MPKNSMISAPTIGKTSRVACRIDTSERQAVGMIGRKPPRWCASDARRATRGTTPEPVEKPASYNRRELPPSPGLFTGPDGTWTLYRNDGKRVAPAPAPPSEAAEPARPKKREFLLCGRGQDDCQQPEEAGERD